MSTIIDNHMADALAHYRKELREITLAYKAGLVPYIEYQQRRGILNQMIGNAETFL